MSKNRHPPCEDVSWNISRKWMNLTICGSSSLWGCELKYITIGYYSSRSESSSLWGCELKLSLWKIVTTKEKSYSLWGCELKLSLWKIVPTKEKSSSLWGCELKWNTGWRSQPCKSHPPCEDVSWNMPVRSLTLSRNGHPPCEDVSWNQRFLKLFPSFVSSSLWGCELKFYLLRMHILCTSHPPCEDVSWNGIPLMQKIISMGHPPCEDVSWNASVVTVSVVPSGHPLHEDVSWNDTTAGSTYLSTVILFMRMWVEMRWKIPEKSRKWSSSSWGCELKYLRP